MDTQMGANIRAARERAGLSQAEAARRVGVSPQQMNNWEGGRACPSVRRLPTLAQVCNTTVDFLLSGVRATETA